MTSKWSLIQLGASQVEGLCQSMLSECCCDNESLLKFVDVEVFTGVFEVFKGVFDVDV